MRLPRCRAAMKWAGAGICAPLLAAWVLNLWYSFGWVFARIDGERRCLVRWHDFVVERPPPTDRPPWPPGFVIFRQSWANVSPRWLPSWRHRTLFDGSRWWSFQLPLWIPVLALGTPAAFLFHFDRRSVRWAREGRCVSCGYDLSGVAGKCPECGR
jgi:hypothetical protein